jgi:Na+-translocating ferredoxin:NAD+ oxidoreductase RnfG subunit
MLLLFIVLLCFSAVCSVLLGVLQRVRAALEGNSSEQRTSALLEDDPTYK